MTNPQHSETPWRVGQSHHGPELRRVEMEVYEGFWVIIADKLSPATAERIVLCVNGRDALVEALKEVYKASENMSLLDCECDPQCPYSEGGSAEDCICEGGKLRAALVGIKHTLAALKEADRG